MRKMYKTQKGITLVALVITIIVLIILAAVSINAVMNDGLIKNAETAVGKYEDAKKEEETELGNLLQKIENAKGNGAQWSLPTDDTEVDVGDLLTPTVPGLENEKFYIIADDGETLTLLAQYCIDTANNTQVSSGFTEVVFDDDSPIYDGSSIQRLVNDYVGSLTGLDLEDVEVEDGGEPVSGVKGKILWFEDLYTTLPNECESEILFGNQENWFIYWIGPGTVNGLSGIYCNLVVGNGVNSDYPYKPEDGKTAGVRPVISVSKSLVE